MSKSLAVVGVICLWIFSVDGCFPTSTTPVMGPNGINGADAALAATRITQLGGKREAKDGTMARIIFGFDDYDHEAAYTTVADIAEKLDHLLKKDGVDVANFVGVLTSEPHHTTVDEFGTTITKSLSMDLKQCLKMKSLFHKVKLIRTTLYLSVKC